MKNWTEEIFNIHSREGKNRPLYEIKDFNGQPIKGKFGIFESDSTKNLSILELS